MPRLTNEFQDCGGSIKDCLATVTQIFKYLCSDPKDINNPTGGDLIKMTTAAILTVAFVILFSAKKKD